MVRNEIAVLKKVSMGHQNILTLVDYFETMNNCAYLLLVTKEEEGITRTIFSIFGYRSSPRRGAI